MSETSEMQPKLRDWAEQAAHDAAMSLPPSDFGSHRAMVAVAALLRSEREKAFAEVAETLAWVRRNYASASCAEINARIDAAISRATSPTP